MELNTYMFNNPLLETRREAYESIDTRKRYKEILSILKGNKMTAKEIAVEMKNRGYSSTDERNLTAPRLHELMGLGKVECIGKVKCSYSGKNVGVYKCTEE